MYVYVLIFLCGRSQVSFYPPTLLSIRVHPQIWSISFQPSVWTLKTDDPQAGVIQRTIPIPFSSKYILLIKKRKLSWTLTHSFSMHPFSNHSFCIGNEWVNYKNKSQKNFNLLNEDYLPLSAILEQCI